MTSRKFMHLLLFCLLPGGFAQAQGVSNAQARKPVVAVYELKDLANTGQAEAFLSMVQTAITTTNRFRVIERNFAVLTAEQNSANSRMVTTNTAGRKGGFEGADFLIYGTITQGQQQNSTDTACKIFLGSRASCTKKSATLSIDIRIVDAHSGQLRWAKTIRQDTQGHVVIVGESTIDYVGMFRSAAQNIATGLTLALYPVKVAAVQPDGVFILNFGGDILHAGDYLQVFGKEAACIPDPDSGECLTSEGSALGTVVVTETADRFSRARAVTPFAQQPAPGAVARIAATPVVDKKKGKR